VNGAVRGKGPKRGGGLSTACGLCTGNAALLMSFRGIDPVQPDTFAGDFYGITVNHAIGANQVGGSTLRSKYDQESKDKERSSGGVNGLTRECARLCGGSIYRAHR
jgi:hypothetical protein